MGVASDTGRTCYCHPTEPAGVLCHQAAMELLTRGTDGGGQVLQMSDLGRTA